MTLILLLFAVLIVVLQIALALTLKRMIDLIAGTRDQIDTLQRRLVSLEHERDSRVPPPSALFTLAPRPEAPPEPLAEPQPTPQATADITDPGLALPVLHEVAADPAPGVTSDAVGTKVRALARQGLPVRDIAERCGLSEAETELIISLRQEPF